MIPRIYINNYKIIYHFKSLFGPDVCLFLGIAVTQCEFILWFTKSPWVCGDIDS